MEFLKASSASTVNLISADPNAEKLILDIARVSTMDTSNASEERDKRLIKHFIDHKEWSPFEHSIMTVEIYTSRAISAQLVRHRSFTFQEFCIDKDSLISTDQGEMVISDIYGSNEVKFLSFSDENKLVYVSGIVSHVGKKNMYEVCLNNGFKINSTLEHMFLTTNGFIPLQQIIEVDDKMVVIGKEKHKLLCIDNHSIIQSEIKNIRYIGERDAYDISIQNKSHNYVANNFIVHNSQRYSSPTGIMIYEARLQDKKNRQNSIDLADEETKQWFINAQETNAKRAAELYEEAIKKGIAKESARFLLPMSTMTRIYMTGSLRSWMTYFSTRLEQFPTSSEEKSSKGMAYGPAQNEHVDIAIKCKEIFTKHYPIISQVFFHN